MKKKCGGYNYWYIRKVADFHKYTVLKNFLEEIFLKIYFSSKMWKKGKIELLSLVYNKSSFHVFKTKNVENVETRNYQRLFKIENVEEMWKKAEWE